ncbi:MAG: DUF255 domain-containing protein [Planctomycetaceae bacterium]|nr:DUF255 domain-containing protein [Planctomycetaceae bacterium]
MTVAQTGIRWEKNFDTAKKRASEENKPLLLHFYGDSCPPCLLMEREIFPNPLIASKVNTDFVAVKIDMQRSPQLSAQYGVHAMPTDVYLSPSGQKVFMRQGKPEVHQLLTEMSNVTAQFPKSRPVQPTQLIQPAQTDQNDYGNPTNIQQAAQNQPTDYTVVTPDSVATSTSTLPQYSPNPFHGLTGYGISSEMTHPQAASAVQPLYQNPQMPIQNSLQMPTNPLSENPAPQQLELVQTADPVTLPQELAPTVMAVPQTMPYQTMPYQPVPYQPVPYQISIAQSYQPLLSVAPQEPYLLQQPADTASAVTAYPGMPVAVGSFENGIVRKQPTAGMGVGTSLGVMAVAHETPEETPFPTVALDGYCPVTLSQTAKWVKGNIEIMTEFDGVIFRFASVDAQNTFGKNPALYAPVLRGNDAVELLTNRREVAGRRKFGAWYHGQVFLFSSAENYEKFQNNPELYAFQAQPSGNTVAAVRHIQPTPQR